MNQVILAENNQNDNDQLLRENDSDMTHKDRQYGFIWEYQVKIIEKLNKRKAKIMFWVVNFEFFLSIATISYLYVSQIDNKLQIYEFFPFVIITVFMVELILKMTLAYNVRKEAEDFHTQKVKKHWQSETIQKLKKEHSKSRSQMHWFWGLLHLEGFYLICLSRKLLQYCRKILQYDESSNQLHEQQVTHQSIQVIFSYLKFRQLYINLKLCVFLMILRSSSSDYSIQLVVNITYMALLMTLNIWLNYHFADVYLFCRSSTLTGMDIFYLLGEIIIKSLHGFVFLYIFTHVESIWVAFSSLFIGVCSILAVAIVLQINSNFDSPRQGLIDLIFFGYSVNYFVGLKHREYFVKRVAYNYKIDLFKQVIIIVTQVVAIILDYYENNQSRFQMNEELILAITCIFGLIRIIMIVFKVQLYILPKQILYRIKTFSGTPHFIEESISSSSYLQTLNLVPNNQRQVQQQDQNQQPFNNQELSQIIPSHEIELSNSYKYQYKVNQSSHQSELSISEMIISKLESSPFLMTFVSEPDLQEFEINTELRVILSEFVKYSKTELIFLISNQIKITNQYGHINVLIHKYDIRLLEFIQNNITPHARSILIDSCYERNTNLQIQSMLLYNTINKEFDSNTKIILKPADMVMQLPISRHRKSQFIKLVNQISACKLIYTLKFIAFHKHLSTSVQSNPQYILYDLLELE